jgi:hypothetical protein
LQTVGAHALAGQRQIGVPDAVLAVLAAGVGLVAVAVAKTGVDAQPHRVAGAGRTELVEHVDRAAVHRHTQLGHAGQRGAVEQVGGKHDVGVAVMDAGGVAGSQRALYFAQRNRINQHPGLAHQPQDMGVGIGLLRKADHIKRAQRGNLALDRGCVIDPQRRAVGFGQTGQGGGGKGVHGLIMPATHQFNQCQFC